MKLESDRTGMEARICQEFLGMPTLSKAAAYTYEAFWGVFESAPSEVENPINVYTGRVKK